MPVFAISRCLALALALTLLLVHPLAAESAAADSPDAANPFVSTVAGVRADTTTSDTTSAGSVTVAPAPREADRVCAIGCYAIPHVRDYPVRPRRSTLSYWAHSRRLMVIDQEHSFGDRYFDRGVFRHITPLIDREYDLDMMAYRFRPAEDARWQQASGGIRMRAGSVERDLWAIKTEIKNTVPLGENGSHLFSIEGVLQEDPQASRSLLEMSYGYALSEKHAIGLRHTFTRYKAGLDVTPFYAYASPTWGRAEVEITFLDAYNNFIYEQLGINTDVLDVVKTYDQKPYLLQLTYASPERYRLGGELIVGWQTESTATFDSQLSDFRFSETERVHYVSALLEYRVIEPVSAGVYLKRDASRLSRITGSDSLNTDYANRQTHQRIGAYVRGEWDHIRGEVYAFTGRYDDIQSGDGFDTSVLQRPFTHDSDMNALSARAIYDANGWPYVGLQYFRFRRDLNVPRLTDIARYWTKQYFTAGPNHERLVFLIGHRFGRGSVAMGIGYDLDADPVRYLDDESPKYFDNGYFRFAMTW